MNSQVYDVAIIGGGIVGLATAMALTEHARLSLIVLEAEDHIAAHQTGHNSGVIHSGLYYKPGSLKARNCVEGRELLYRFCAENGIAHDRCGKLVVATREDELSRLDELERRGQANGLQGLRHLSGDELHDYEPHASGIAALLVPETGIVDYAQVAKVYAQKVCDAGGVVQTGSRVRRIDRRDAELVLETTRGEVHCRYVIACAGLQADRVARLCGIDPQVRIVPFRGEYYELIEARRSLVKNLIYPVPDPRFPFLGVHFTRMIHGGVEAGPNAVLAFKREGYRKTSFSFNDALSLATYAGFWRMAARYWKTALAEFYRSLSKRVFVKSLQRLIPELHDDDVRAAGAGVRAQALNAQGKLVDDFHIIEAERMIHVLNAPSPAATASISVGRTIAAMAMKSWELEVRV